MAGEEWREKIGVNGGRRLERSPELRLRMVGGRRERMPVEYCQSVIARLRSYTLRCTRGGWWTHLLGHDADAPHEGGDAVEASHELVRVWLATAQGRRGRRCGCVP